MSKAKRLDLSKILFIYSDYVGHTCYRNVQLHQCTFHLYGVKYGSGPMTADRILYCIFRLSLSAFTTYKYDSLCLNASMQKIWSPRLSFFDFVRVPVTSHLDLASTFRRKDIVNKKTIHIFLCNISTASSSSVLLYF